MSALPTIKIVVADDHPIFRAGVISVFTTQQREGFTVIGEAANGKEVIELLKTSQPDVVLMDVEMPEMDGIEATAIIKRNYPLVRTIALSYSDTINKVVQMIDAGADGYLLKDSNVRELLHAISMVHAGNSYFSPAAGMHLAASMREFKAGIINLKRINFTQRESEILKMICAGDSSKEIAATLFLSKRTVDSFREKIMKKTGAKNLVQLLRFAIKNQLVKA